MSKTIYNFELKETSTEHHLISKSPNLIITTQGEAGVADVFMASKWGEYNHVAGFVSGEDKIQIPLAVIQAICTEQGATATALTKGELPAAKFSDEGDTIFWNSAGNQLLYMPAGIGTGDIHPVCILTLDGTPGPTVAATDIEIV